MHNSIEMFTHEKLHFADIGASGGIHKRWKHALLPIQAYLFEPDRQSAELLEQHGHKVFCCAVGGEDGTLPFYCGKIDASSSSLFEPNVPLLDLFPNSKRFEISKSISIPVRTLNSLYRDRELPVLDMLKLDTQGAELDILRHADLLLPNVIGIEAEVSFMELYKKQPLFRDLDSYLSGYGFELFDLRRVWWQRKKNRRFSQPRGQLAFGDALYLRSPEAICAIAKNNAHIELAAWAIYYAYGYYDCCELLLENMCHASSHLTDFLAQKLASHWPCPHSRFPGEGRLENLWLRIGDSLFQRKHTHHDKILGNQFYD